MSGIGEVWEMRCGAEVLGEITVTEVDFPWVSGGFAARAGFARFAPLFAEELALLGPALDDDSAVTVDDWEAVYGRIDAAVTLVAPGGPVAEFLVHIDGDAAWFRWSDD